jgi:predicted regulator of Ras-like GTPase activity (Roadblock/LC7/MglB family)
MSGDLTGLVSTTIASVRGGRGSLVMDFDGVSIDQATQEPNVDLELLAGEFAGLLREARTLAANLGWDAVRTFSVRARDRQVVFAFGPDDLLLGVEAGPTGLCGQMRAAAKRAADRLEDG